MTELPLIAFFILSSFYFTKFLKNTNDLLPLVFAAFFGFCASLSRYDGWFLVALEAGILVLLYALKPSMRKAMEGKFILFSTLAFFGILLWLLWDFLILGDPFYFSNSPFSAKSQQQGWLAKGELPTYKNIAASVGYYTVTSLHNTGAFIFLLMVVGLLFYLFKGGRERWYFVPILLVPFIFYVVTLFMGQSVIFIPDLTPANFEWNLFNTRYGIMMVAPAAFFAGFVFSKLHTYAKPIVILLFLLDIGLFLIGQEKIITLEDGTNGLSAYKRPTAQDWLAKNYNGGLVLLDDYARTLSVIRTNLPMQNVIYIGNKPYWEESLREPEKYATWIVMQKGDSVWKSLNDDPVMQGRVYKYFLKVYTSPEIVIFRKPTNTT